MKIIKRDGSKVDFSTDKIIVAITQANQQVIEEQQLTKEEIDQIAESIAIDYLQSEDTKTVEDVSDDVERHLVELGAYEVAKEYITYRYKRKVARDNYSTFMEAVTEKIMAKNVENQNANVDERSFGGRLGEATRVLTKDYALKYCLSDMARENHINNRIYEHDLDSFVLGEHNCLTCPIDHLLAEGFKVRQTDIRPANSVSTAMQLVAVIFQVQSLMQFGGVSCSHLDWSMVPYIRKSFFKHYKDGLYWIDNMQMPNTFDNTMSILDHRYQSLSKKAFNYAYTMTKKECDQACEGLFHNLNSLQSRSGNQLPFSSINFGTCTLEEGRMVIHSLLDASINGIGKFHKTPIFPCSIFQYAKGINDKPGTPNYDLYRLALKSTAKRLYPNYVNIDWSGNAGYDKNDPKTYMSTMGLAA